MVTLSKIQTLGNAGSHDLCAGSECRTIMHQSLDNAIYPAMTGTGKCVNLFKTLMTNACINDCKYCEHRLCKSRRLTSYEPHELADTFMNLVKLNKVEGLFLSSGVRRDPDETMTAMVRAVTIIREHYSFKGYVHLKVLPGVNKYLTKRACELADRVSVNLETTPERLSELSSDKNSNSLLTRLKWVDQESRRGQLKAGLTTQLIIGAAGEKDSEVLKLTNRLYKSLDLRRVYFSAFTPLKDTPLENQSRINPLRAHRLYQSDYLIREYGFKEVPLSDGFLDLNKDPKVIAAQERELRVNPNNASRQELLQVPGIGPKTVSKILLARQEKTIRKMNELKSLGVITKRALPHLELNGEAQTMLAY